MTDRPVIVRRIREMIVGTEPEGAASVLRGMAVRKDHTSFLSRIIAPTLIVVGSNDSITPVADSELMHREIGGSRLRIMEGAGHVSNLERAEEFNRELVKFINDVEA